MYETPSRRSSRRVEYTLTFDGKIRQVAFSPDGRIIAIVLPTNLRLLDASTRTSRRPRRGESTFGKFVAKAAFLDDNTLVSVFQDQLCVWRAPSFAEIAALEQIRQAEQRR